MVDSTDAAAVAYAALVADAGPTGWRVAADPARLPFAEAVFDAAAVTLALDPARLREVWRVLSPAGVLVAVVPRRRLLHSVDPLLGQHYSSAALTRLLASAMFETVEWTKIDGFHVVLATKRDGLAPIGGGTPAPVRLAPT